MALKNTTTILACLVVLAFIAPGATVAETDTTKPLVIKTYPEGCFAACEPLELETPKPGQEILLWMVWCKTSTGVSIPILNTSDSCGGIGEYNCDESTLCNPFVQSVDSAKEPVNLPPLCKAGLEVLVAGNQVTDPDQVKVLAGCDGDPINFSL